MSNYVPWFCMYIISYELIVHLADIAIEYPYGNSEVCNITN